MRRLKVIPEERKNPWSSSNFFKAPKRKWSFPVIPFFQPIDAMGAFPYPFVFTPPDLS
jgi:hypothetical protein